jgi:hypothetical protein
MVKVAASQGAWQIPLLKTSDEEFLRSSQLCTTRLLIWLIFSITCSSRGWVTLLQLQMLVGNYSLQLAIIIWVSSSVS